MSEANTAVQALVTEVKRLKFATEQHIGSIMSLLDTANLRRASRYDLEALKRRLRKFNMNTGKWSD